MSDPKVTAALARIRIQARAQHALNGNFRARHDSAERRLGEHDGFIVDQGDFNDGIDGFVTHLSDEHDGTVARVGRLEAVTYGSIGKAVFWFIVGALIAVLLVNFAMDRYVETTNTAVGGQANVDISYRWLILLGAALFGGLAFLVLTSFNFVPRDQVPPAQRPQRRRLVRGRRPVTQAAPATPPPAAQPNDTAAVPATATAD